MQIILFWSRKNGPQWNNGTEKHLYFDYSKSRTNNLILIRANLILGLLYNHDIFTGFNLKNLALEYLCRKWSNWTETEYYNDPLTNPTKIKMTDLVNTQSIQFVNLSFKIFWTPRINILHLS